MYVYGTLKTGCPSGLFLEFFNCRSKLLLLRHFFKHFLFRELKEESLFKKN